MLTAKKAKNEMLAAVSGPWTKLQTAFSPGAWPSNQGGNVSVSLADSGNFKQLLTQEHGHLTVAISYLGFWQMTGKIKQLNFQVIAEC